METMTRKLASIVTISDVMPIPDTDRLSVAMMKGKGWQCVVGRNDFQIGDKAVYFEIDSALPNEDRYALLRDRCLKQFRTKNAQTILKECIVIRTIKLRGLISQGLLMPLSHFPEVTSTEDGTDLTELLRVEHIDEILLALRPSKSVAMGVSNGTFPSFIPKTDEERIQNLADLFLQEELWDTSFEVTEKADGSSVTMYYTSIMGEDKSFGVCSRNVNLKKVDATGNTVLPWLMAEKYDVETKLRIYHVETGIDIALQGELIGPGIQSNRDMLTDHEWRVFRVWDITNQRFLSPASARNLCEHLQIPYVKVVSADLKLFSQYHSVKDVLTLAEGKTDRGNEREGLVFKSNGIKYFSFKAVSNKYLLNLSKKDR